MKAINDEGESEPLEGDKPIKAKNPFGKCAILHCILYILMASHLHFQDLMARAIFTSYKNLAVSPVAFFLRIRYIVSSLPFFLNFESGNDIS